MSQRWSNLLVWAGTVAFVVCPQQGGVGGQPGQRDQPDEPHRLRPAARGHHRDVRERARRRVHDDGHLQLRPGRDRDVPRVRRLGADGRPRLAAAVGAAARRARGRAADRDRSSTARSCATSRASRWSCSSWSRSDCMFAFIGLANMIWNQNSAHSMPALFGGHGFHVGQVVMTWHRFLTIMLAVALAIGLRILLFRTRLGIAMRAVVDNRDLAASGARARRCCRASRGRSAARSRRWPASCSRPSRPACRRRRSRS